MHSVCLIVDLICISITLTIHNKQQQTNTQEITEIKHLSSSSLTISVSPCTAVPL